MIDAIMRRTASVIKLLHPPKVVIYAPKYTYLHSGVRCLHLLCDRLNQLGISAAVTCSVTDPRAMTPQIYRNALTLAPSILNESIVIYPETIRGNPLGARHIVRYLLRKPRFSNGHFAEFYGDNDYFIHFAEEFRPLGLKSQLLRLPLIDTSIFTPPERGTERQGFLIYDDRYRPDLKSFPDWIEDQTIISRETPRNPSTLASLYRCSRALIVGERTAAVPEALHCHCPVIMLPHPGFEYEPIFSFFGGYGLVLGFDPEGLIRATETAPAFRAHYEAQFIDVDRRLLELIADIGRHFGLRRLEEAAP